MVDTLKSYISQTKRHALSGEMEGKPWKVVDFQRKETDGQSFLSLMTYGELLSYSSHLPTDTESESEETAAAPGPSDVAELGAKVRKAFRTLGDRSSQLE